MLWLYVRHRLFSVGGSIYQVVVVGLSGRENAPAANAFLDSLSLAKVNSPP
jgi:hypothetical protein